MLQKLFIALLTKSITFLLGMMLLDKPKLYEVFFVFVELVVTEEFVGIEEFLAIEELVLIEVFVKIVEFVGIVEFEVILGFPFNFFRASSNLFSASETLLL